MPKAQVILAVAALAVTVAIVPARGEDVIDEAQLQELIEVIQAQQVEGGVIVRTAPPRPAIEDPQKLVKLVELKAKLAQAEAEHARNAKLLEQGAITQKEVDASAAQIADIKKKMAVLNGEKPDEEEKPEEESPGVDKPVDPDMIEFFLSDGTILSGKLAVKSVDIETRFGVLTVPIEKIRRFKPGLESRPGMKERIAGFLEALNADDANARKQAGEEIIKLGPGIRDVLIPLAESTKDAPRAAELRAIISKLNDIAGPDDFNVDPNKVMSMRDVLETTEFTMTGSIRQQQFALATEYGSFALPLSAVVRAERGGGVQELRKALTITESELAPRSFKSTGLRIDKGDVIHIRASGTLSMTRWGSNAVSTPEGMPNYGWYINGKVPNGALCLRIGSGGEVTKVGRDLNFIAKEAGTLYLAIGMTDRYARDNYRFPGEYKVQVKVEKK